MRGYPPAQGLYDPRLEHDACGVGFLCHIKGKASNRIIMQALEMLENMNHRGACGCEPNSGDGAGILVHLPDGFLRRKCAELGFTLPPLNQYGVANVFLPQDVVQRNECQRILEKVVADNGMVTLGWRDVPTDNRHIGPTPRRCEPRIRQIFVGMASSFYNRQDFDRRLYLVRQRTENNIEFSDLPEDARRTFYICALSASRIIYKGMLTADQVRQYFPDLSEPDFESALAVIHSRFSTNTFPSWDRAHPYRYLAHNGEINTLRGNRNWMRARYGSLQSEIFGDELQKMFPILTESGSDTATIDNALQFLTLNGRSLAHSVLMLIPEAWQNNHKMDEELKAFYEYHACLMEPWDGPASIVFTNGAQVGAVLDRNGLRPSRYYVTKDDLVVMASEVGVLPIKPENVVRKWRLQPGKIFLIDFKQGRIIDDNEIKRNLVEKRPWKEWLNQYMIPLDDLPAPRRVHQPNHQTLRVRQHAFGYTVEELKMIMMPMATNGQEAIGSMGADTPLACLSDKPQLLYTYFRQLFAQVTNPPLDAIREELVTSLYTYLGREGNLLSEEPKNCHLIKLRQPILSNSDLEKLREVAHGRPSGGDSADAVQGLRRGGGIGEGGGCPVRGGGQGRCRRGVDPGAIGSRGGRRARSDSQLAGDGGGASSPHPRGARTQCGLVIETGEARESHHFCLLIGYGAGAINPYLVFETLADLHKDGMLPEGLSLEDAKKNFIKAANKGILKVASKMGISTVQSYRGAQIFEAIGLSRRMVDKFFTNTASRINGVDLDVIARESLMRHRHGFPPIRVNGEVLDNGGFYQWRRDGEYHMWNPDTIGKMQHAVRLGITKPIDGFKAFQEYTRLCDDEARHLCTLRGLLKIKQAAKPIPLEEVEPAKEIVKRFVTGAMSFGSISKEAHENLAIAMNRIGGKSNTGEGGEDAERFLPDRDSSGKPIIMPELKLLHDSLPAAQSLRRSAIKQVASARFGVTAEYLVNAAELQIKMAQGAKPGEGGQLPGHKVDEYIGKIRHSTPGVGLISPPPHHDIYSIEDLAQLIHDLKNGNREARISVKLVSEVGVGTVAAGVAKAKADHILISGDSGGTGASPLTSIKYAGIPWELGVSETQQTLVLNDLRGRIILQTDGQFKTGRDVVIAALLGAEEFGFSTGPLIAAGCIMMRVCHLNTCPVGIATQDPELRRRFTGKPEHVINFMFFIAEEVRQFMAQMGFRKFEEMVGQTQMLEFADLSDHWKAKSLDLSVILHKPAVGPNVAIRHVQKQDHGLEAALDNRLLKLAAPALEKGEKVRAELPINNVNRTVGAMLSSEIAKKHGHAGLPDGTIHFKFTGSAGQSFGCFLARGVTLELEGDANDYCGKGLSGGRVIVYPPKNSSFKAEENIVAGNVIGYGAIAGEIYLRGVVGERFCVRNSGAEAVVEGVGDHGCEYMTGGRVVVIGPTGRNFAAGMSGGIAYVHDTSGQFKDLCNLEMVELERPEKAEDVKTIRRLLENHRKYTGSPVAKAILDDFEEELKWFVKVMPTDYRRVLEHRVEVEEKARLLAQRQT